MSEETIYYFSILPYISLRENISIGDYTFCPYENYRPIVEKEAPEIIPNLDKLMKIWKDPYGKDFGYGNNFWPTVWYKSDSPISTEQLSDEKYQELLFAVDVYCYCTARHSDNGTSDIFWSYRGGLRESENSITLFFPGIINTHSLDTPIYSPHWIQPSFGNIINKFPNRPLFEKSNELFIENPNHRLFSLISDFNSAFSTFQLERRALSLMTLSRCVDGILEKLGEPDSCEYIAIKEKAREQGHNVFLKTKTKESLKYHLFERIEERANIDKLCEWSEKWIDLRNPLAHGRIVDNKNHYFENVHQVKILEAVFRCLVFVYLENKYPPPEYKPTSSDSGLTKAICEITNSDECKNSYIYSRILEPFPFFLRREN